MKNVKRTLLAAVLFACAIACGKKESPSPQTSINPSNPTDTTSIPKPTPIDSCGTDNPVEKLSWIGDLRLKSYPKPRMYSHIYENKMVFAFSPCFDCGDDKMTIFNCKGETLADGKAKCDVMLQKANNPKLLFDGNLPVCGTDNPVEKLSWIADLRSKTYPQPRMYSYAYSKQIIFAFSETGTFSDEKVKIFNCNGEILAEGKVKCDEMLQKANNQKLLFDGNLTDCDRVKNPIKEVSWIPILIAEAEKMKAEGKNPMIVIYSCLFRGRRIYAQALRHPTENIFFVNNFWDCKIIIASEETITGINPVYYMMLNESTNWTLIYKS